MVSKTLKRLAACLMAALTFTAAPALADDEDIRTALRIAIEAGVFGDDVRSAVRSNQDWQGFRRNSSFNGNGELVLYEDPNFRGRQLVINDFEDTLNGVGFNDRASSLRVYSGRWQVCTDSRYGGRCEIVDRSVSRLSEIGLNDRITSVRPIDRFQSHANSRLVLFESSNYRGRQVVIDRFSDDLRNVRFNDIASSARVFGGSWELCANTRYGGRCEILRGDLNTLSSIGLNDRITSVRPVNQFSASRDDRYYNDRDDDYGYRNGGYGRGDDRLYGGRSDDYDDPSFGFATVFADPDCRGRSLDVSQPIARLRDFGFDNIISSISIQSGAFEVCSNTNFRGRCQIITRDIGYLRDIGLNDSISSIRPVRQDDRWYDDDGRRHYPY